MHRINDEMFYKTKKSDKVHKINDKLFIDRKINYSKNLFILKMLNVMVCGKSKRFLSEKMLLKYKIHLMC